MARQTGDIKIVGTVDGICFYRMEGEFFAREKSSLDGERFFSDPAFEGSRRSASALADASALGSKLYKKFPKEKKGRPVFQKLVGEIRRLFAQGFEIGEIEEYVAVQYLLEEIIQVPVIQKGTEKRKYAVSPVTYSKIPSIIRITVSENMTKCRKHNSSYLQFNKVRFKGLLQRHSAIAVPNNLYLDGG